VVPNAEVVVTSDETGVKQKDHNQLARELDRSIPDPWALRLHCNGRGIQAGRGLATFSVPTAVERQGDFTQSFTTQLVNGVRNKFPLQIYDPQSVDAGGNRTLFPGLMIPASRLSPIAQKILAKTQLPNVTGDPTGNATNNYVASSPSTDFMAMIAIRGDHIWSDNQKSFANVRWSHYDGTSNNFFLNDTTAYIAFESRF